MRCTNNRKLFFFNSNQLENSPFWVSTLTFDRRPMQCKQKQVWWKKNFGLLYSLRKRGKKFAPTRSHPSLCSAFTTFSQGRRNWGCNPPPSPPQILAAVHRVLEPSPSNVLGLFLAPGFLDLPTALYVTCHRAALEIRRAY